MKILVANLGSTSFKYRLFDVSDPAEPVLARGAIERIGSPDRPGSSSSRTRGEREMDRPIADHGDAVQLCLDQLTDPEIGVLADAGDVAAIGFKAVHARNLTGVHRVDDHVLEAMEAFADVAPAHNPPYTKAMRMLRDRFPSLPLVAAFETGFHRTIPEANQRYAIPEAWATELGVRRWGFHGASHRYISWRMPELLGRADIKIISCHLGGSSSLCAIRNGQSVACSLGMSPQSGLPHNNRVGDFDVFALPVLLRETGKSLEEILDILANQSGLEGPVSARDLRDIEAAAAAGDVACRAGHRRLHRLDPPLPRCLPARAGRGRCDRLHRRHRRELGTDPLGRLPRPRLVRHRARPAAERQRPGRATGLRRRLARSRSGPCPTNEELVVARQSRTLLDSGKRSMM